MSIQSRSSDAISIDTALASRDVEQNGYISAAEKGLVYETI